MVNPKRQVWVTTHSFGSGSLGAGKFTPLVFFLGLNLQRCIERPNKDGTSNYFHISCNYLIIINYQGCFILVCQFGLNFQASALMMNGCQWHWSRSDISQVKEVIDDVMRFV